MKALLTAAVFSTAILAAGIAQAQSRPERAASIKMLMSASDGEATGIRTLSQTQLEALSVWLDDYRAAITSLALEALNEDRGAEDQIIESRIDGDFDGWVGDTVFRLQNGQIWQQTSRSAKYLFAHAPKVVISAVPHQMRVEGLEAEIAVRRLK